MDKPVYDPQTCWPDFLAYCDEQGFGKRRSISSDPRRLMALSEAYARKEELDPEEFYSQIVQPGLAKLEQTKRKATIQAATSAILARSGNVPVSSEIETLVEENLRRVEEDEPRKPRD